MAGVTEIKCWDKGVVTQAGDRFVVVFPNGIGFFSNGLGSDWEDAEFSYSPKLSFDPATGVPMCEYGRLIDLPKLPEVLLVHLNELLTQINRNEWQNSHSPAFLMQFPQ
jgi:hypothetical protein